MSAVSPYCQIGYLLPHRYTDIDGYQFYAVAPDGVLFVASQLPLDGYHLDAIRWGQPDFWERVGVLAGKKVDRICLSGTSIAALLGRQAVLGLLTEARERTGLPVDTDLEGCVAALGHLGASKVALATRWPQRLDDALAAYLADAGIEVVALRSRPRELDENRGASFMADHELALELGRAALRDAPDAEALLLPGGLWFAVNAAAQIERELDVPVVVNVTATIWSALRDLDDRPTHGDPRWGRLIGSL